MILALGMFVLVFVTGIVVGLLLLWPDVGKARRPEPYDGGVPTGAKTAEKQENTE